MPISEKEANEHLDYLSKVKNKNERLSWKRKHDKMQKIIEAMAPLQDEILRIMNEQRVYVDEINELRNQMVRECVHPRDQLVHNGNSVTCKFCNVKMGLPIGMKASDEDE